MPSAGIVGSSSQQSASRSAMPNSSDWSGVSVSRRKSNTFLSMLRTVMVAVIDLNYLGFIRFVNRQQEGYMCIGILAYRNDRDLYLIITLK